MQLTQQNLQFLFNQFEQRFQDGYKRRKTYHDQYAEQMPSGTETNVYGWLAELPGLREWIGPRLMRNIASRVYSLTNKDYEDSVALDTNKIKDDTYGLYGRSIELLGDASARWPDDIVTDQLKNGITSLCYDGQAFFSSAHPVDIDDSSQGTYSNRLDSTTSGALPLNNAATYLDNFATAYSTMMSFKGESGKELEVQPTILMVPPQLQKYGKLIAETSDIVIAVQQGGSNVAATSVPNPYAGLVKCIVNPRLSGDANTWYLFSTDRIKPLLFQLRQAPETTMVTDPQNPIVFQNRQFAYGVHARGIPGFTLPFLAIRCST